VPSPPQAINQIRLFLGQVPEPSVKVDLRGEGLDPFLGDVFAIEHSFEGLSGRPRVRFRPVDDDDDFADFHD